MKEHDTMQSYDSIVEALAYKQSNDAKYGLLFHRHDRASPLIIKEIRTASIFHSSKLKSGMLVLEINGIETMWMSPSEGARLLRKADVGAMLSIKATTPFTIQAAKESTESKWGFAIKNSTTQHGIFIRTVSPNGPFAGTDLRVGMKIIQINKRPCPQQIREATQLIKESDTEMEIMVVEQAAPEERDEMELARSEDDLLETRMVSDNLYTIFGGTGRDEMDENGGEVVPNSTEDLDMDDYYYEFGDINRERPPKASKEIEAAKPVVVQTFKEPKQNKRKPSKAAKSVNIGKKKDIKIKSQEKWFRFKGQKKTTKKKAKKKAPRKTKSSIEDEEEWVDLDEEELTVCSEEEKVWYQQLFPPFSTPSGTTTKNPSAPQHHEVQLQKVATPFVGNVTVVVGQQTTDNVRAAEQDSWIESMFPWTGGNTAKNDSTKSTEKLATPTPLVKSMNRKGRTQQPNVKGMEKKGSKAWRKKEAKKKAGQKKNETRQAKITTTKTSKSKKTTKKESSNKPDAEMLSRGRSRSLFDRSRASGKKEPSKNNKKKVQPRRPASQIKIVDGSKPSPSPMQQLKRWNENVYRAVCTCPDDTTLRDDQEDGGQFQSRRKIKFRVLDQKKE